RLGALGPALRVTGEASFWCMATTLAGFLSLLLASAEPLRELGKAGAVGTLIALAAAYGLYPPFLRDPRRGPDRSRRTPNRAEPDDAAGAAAPPPAPPARDPFGGRRLGAVVAVIALLAGVAALGLPRITTDPGLLAYFDAGSAIHAGLEAVDRAGGSSPLNVLFRDAAEGSPGSGGGRLDTDDALGRLAAVQEELEADPAVGTVLSLAPLVDEAARFPMAGFMSTERLVDTLASPAFGGVAESFVTPDRTRGLLALRMREHGGAPAPGERSATIGRVRSTLRDHGFEPEAVAGLYELQGELAELVASSLLTGLGGLFLLFVGVSWAVSRRLRDAGAMLVCLAGTPLFLFGTLGLAGVPVDFISSPAANVALAVGIDSMIHLTAAARRARREGLAPWAAWVEARARLARPVAGAGLILAAGFGLFVLSSFPPTRRFGLAVVVGIVAATALTLVVLPWLAGVRRSGPRARPAPDDSPGR
ncbi:MAG: MMPL family transporter, partial [Acidobacteriota bacterium]